jgi:hypothetical protein
MPPEPKAFRRKIWKGGKKRKNLKEKGRKRKIKGKVDLYG